MTEVTSTWVTRHSKCPAIHLVFQPSQKTNKQTNEIKEKPTVSYLTRWLSKGRHVTSTTRACSPDYTIIQLTEATAGINSSQTIPTLQDNSSDSKTLEGWLILTFSLIN